MTEKEIQNYIWNNKENFTDFLVDVVFPKKISHDKPWEYTPSEIIYNDLLDKYTEMWYAIHELHFFGYEVPLKKELDSTIRADFLGVLGGRNGLAVVELKKSEQTERQAYTELLAYGSHIRAVFAPMSKMDVVYILISPMQERIVREATIQSIMYDRNEVFSLIPAWKDDDISTLKLTPWIPTFSEVDSLIQPCFSETNFDVFKVTWDGLPGEWSPEKKGENPNQYMVERMNTVSSFAAQILEAKGIHGFVFCSQAWSELRDTGHLINSIVIGGINPYQATKNRVLIQDYDIPPKYADKVNIDSVSMLEVLPELERFAEKENEETNYLSNLSMTWSNEITSVGFEVVKLLTKSLKREWIETSYGGFDWESYQRNSMEDIYCHNFDIRTTGLIRELFFSYSALDYDYIRANGSDEHPTYGHGDIPNDLIDISTSQIYVRDFLKRLFNPYHEFEFDDDDIEDFENEK